MDERIAAETATARSDESPPPDRLGPDDLRWLRSIRNGAALVFTAGAASLWWPGHPFGFDVESPYLAFVLNSLPLIVPILLGWYGAWVLLCRRRTPARLALPGGLWRWGLRLGATAFAFLPFVIPAMEKLSIDPGVTAAELEPYVAMAAPVLTGLVCVHLALLAWATRARWLAANAAVLAAGLPVALGAMLRMNQWHLQFKQIMPPFHPVLGIGYPAVFPITLGFFADQRVRWSWRSVDIVGVGVGGVWAIIVFLCLAMHFARLAHEVKRLTMAGSDPPMPSASATAP